MPTRMPDLRRGAGAPARRPRIHHLGGPGERGPVTGSPLTDDAAIRLRVTEDAAATITVGRRRARVGPRSVEVALERESLDDGAGTASPRDRMKPGDWIALASLALAVVTYGTSVIKDDRGAPVIHLVTVIDERVPDRPGQQDLHQPLRQQDRPGNLTPAGGAPGPGDGTGSRPAAGQ